MITNYVSIVFFSILLAITLITGDVNTAFWVVFMMWGYNIIYALKKPYERSIFLAFNFTFFIFLIGNIFVSKVTSIPAFKSSVLDLFSVEIQEHMLVALFLSLSGLLVGFSYFETKYKVIKIKRSIDLNNRYISNLRKYSKRIIYLTFWASLILQIERAMYVQTVSYVDSYVDFQSHLPSIVRRIATLYDYSFLLFLATIPKYKEAKLPIIIYLILGSISLGYGQRTGVCITFAFLFIYFALRQKYKFYGDSDIWITKKLLISVFVSLPFFIVFLYTFAQTRLGYDANDFGGILGNLEAFLYQQGRTVQLIGYEQIFQDKFPQSWYSFSFMFEFFQHNYISESLNLFKSYQPQTIEYALNGYNFGSAITYLVEPEQYVLGYGLGSCYIAEAYHDFGFVGLFLLNAFYGFIFSYSKQSLHKGVWATFAYLMILEELLMAPRGSDTYFIKVFISVFLFAYFILMRYFAKKNSIK